MAVEPFMYELMDPIHSREDSLGGGPARRKPLPTQDNINREETRTYIHASSWIRTHDPSVLQGGDIFILDRAATVIGKNCFSNSISS
jgi:hypothetical protein